MARRWCSWRPTKYGVAFGVGLGEVAGKVFRIGHLGMLTDVMVLSGLATAEMCMADLGWPVQSGIGRGGGAGVLSAARLRDGPGGGIATGRGTRGIEYLDKRRRRKTMMRT